MSEGTEQTPAATSGIGRTQPGIGNPMRLAALAFVTLILAFIFAVIPVHDSNGSSCGSALDPGPANAFDSQTGGCELRVTSQQGWAFPLMLLSAVVCAGGLVWRDRSS